MKILWENFNSKIIKDLESPFLNIVLEKWIVPEKLWKFVGTFFRKFVGKLQKNLLQENYQENL